MTEGSGLELGGPVTASRISRLHYLTSFAAASFRSLVPASGGASFDTVERLSDELKATAVALGLEGHTARRLLSLRELLDSHLLTATAISGCDLDDTAAIAMVQRGIAAVAAGLPEGRADRYGTVGITG